MRIVPCVAISWVLVVASVVVDVARAQNDVDVEPHQQHNELGCDCMEYWTCITR